MQTSRKSYHAESSSSNLPESSSCKQGKVPEAGRKVDLLSLTRPDIAYVVSVVSQFMHSPSEDHMATVMRILSYLKGAHCKRLIFRKHGHMETKGYTDADWARNITDRRYTLGYFTFVVENVVTWRSKKQNMVARSMAEAEYWSMAHGICELL